MGWVQFRLGRLKEAEELLKRAYALRPDIEIAVHLGEVLWVEGQKNDTKSRKDFSFSWSFGAVAAVSAIPAERRGKAARMGKA